MDTSGNRKTQCNKVQNYRYKSSVKKINKENSFILIQNIVSYFYIFFLFCFVFLHSVDFMSLTEALR